MISCNRIEQTEQAVQPRQLIVRAEAADQREKIAAKAGHGRRDVPEDQSIPIRKPVYQLVEMGSQADEKGRKKADDPFPADALADICEKMFGNHSRLLSVQAGKSVDPSPALPSRRRYKYDGIQVIFPKAT